MSSAALSQLQSRICFQIFLNIFSRFFKPFAVGFGLSLISINFVCAQPAEAGKTIRAANENLAAFQKCWTNSAAEAAAVSFIVKNEKIILPQPNGALTALSVVDGETLWRSDLGGEITAQIAANDEFVFVATAAIVNTETSTLVRAVSLATGVTVWRAEFAKTALTRLTLANNSLLIVMARADNAKNQELAALNFANGEKIWAKPLPVTAVSALKSFGAKIYYTGIDNHLRILDARDGGETKQFGLPHAAIELTIDQTGKLLISDQTGYVSAVRETDGKKLWTLRLGGAVQQILLAADQVLILSLDDFVYLHSVKSGKRRWRKRLANRPFGAVLIEDKAALIIVSGADEHLILNLDKGAPIGQLTFPDQSFATALPIFKNNRLIIGTSTGVIGWRAAANCADEKQ